MKLLAAAIVLVYALVSIGQAHQVSTMYKTSPAMVGAIWNDCSKTTYQPHLPLACMHNSMRAGMFMHVLNQE